MECEVSYTKARISPRSTDCAPAPGAAKKRLASDRTTASAARNTTFSIFIVSLPLVVERTAANFDWPECAKYSVFILLTRQPGIEQLEKLFGVDAGANLDVWFHVIYAFDDVAIAVQHVALDGIAAIGDSLAAGEFSARFDVHVHWLRRDDGRIDGGADGERVVHRRTSARAVFGFLTDQESENLHGEVVFGAVSFRKLIEMRLVVESFIADIEADHGQAPAGVEDDLRGFGIVVDVGFGRGVHVAAGNRAAHDYDFLHQRNDGRVFQQGESDVGERAHRDQSDLVRRLVNHLNDQVGAEAGIGLALARWQVYVGQTIGAVPEFGGDQLLKQGMLRAAGDRYVAAIGERCELQSVFQALLRGHITGDNGESAHIEFRRIQREQDRERVVGARVGIDDYFFGGGRCGATSRARRIVRACCGSDGEDDERDACCKHCASHYRDVCGDICVRGGWPHVLARSTRAERKFRARIVQELRSN